MSWGHLTVARDRSHHVTREGEPAYLERFDEVLKFHSPGLAPVSRAARAWHILPDGAPAYSRRFVRAFGFYEGMAAVVSEDGWHHIAPDGSDVYPGRHAWCGNFQGGRCAVREPDGAYLHIDSAGRPAYQDRWRYAGDYRDGVAVVQAADGRSTHIDLGGGQMHGRWFLDLDVFHKGYARARDGRGWTHVDAMGAPVYERRFANVEPFYNGQARVERLDGGLEVIDESGMSVVELRPARRSELAALSGDMVGFWRTHTIGAAVRLGVIEALPAPESEVAERCGLRVEGARRLLRALGELHLTERRGTTWQLTVRGAFLRPEHPMTLADAAFEYAGPFSRAWERLPDALRSGADWRAPDNFGEVAGDELRRPGHHRMLRSYARHDYSTVVGALGLRGDERIIDAGGGLGTLAALVLMAHPAARVTVLDRPEVVEQGRSEQGKVTGLSWRAGDLFDAWRLEADVVLLARVLHDWCDEAARRILLNARAALPAGGRVLIIEMLIPEGTVAGALCDLHLLMVNGGRERSAAELEHLLNDAGFELLAVRSVAALPAILIGAAT